MSTLVLALLHVNLIRLSVHCSDILTQETAAQQHMQIKIAYCGCMFG